MSQPRYSNNTIFVNPQLIDESKSYVMSWPQLKQLAQEGALIASHHLNHDYLHELQHGESLEQWRVRIKQELTTAQARIADEIGHDLPWVAYPYGEYNREVQAIVSELGLIGIGQQSGAVGTTTDWTAVPRFPASGVYANIDTLSVKLNSKAFPIDHIEYHDTVTTDTQPIMTLKFKEKSFHQSQFACYVTGQELADIKWLDKLTVRVSAKKPLKNGRSRYNCTAPTKEDSTRYYWYSQQWLVKASEPTPSP
jgi:peptidoglycan/xylan/chitin deacetylase (PgdA/CDA1 family)